MLTEDGKHLYVSYDEYNNLLEKLAIKIHQSRCVPLQACQKDSASGFEIAVAIEEQFAPRRPGISQSASVGNAPSTVTNE